jgi:hypothetical protein
MPKLRLVPPPPPPPPHVRTSLDALNDQIQSVRKLFTCLQ